MHTVESHTRVYMPLVLALSVCLLAPCLLYADQSSVTNNVSVQANSSGSGSSKASVKTVINGVTVEDKTITAGPGEDIHYESSFTGGGASSSIAVSEEDGSSLSVSRVETQEQLRSTLEELLSLLRYYVSLLNAQS